MSLIQNRQRDARALVRATRAISTYAGAARGAYKVAKFAYGVGRRAYDSRSKGTAKRVKTTPAMPTYSSKKKGRKSKCKTLKCKVAVIERKIANLEGTVRIRYKQNYTLFANNNEAEYFGSNSLADQNAGGIGAGAPALVRLFVNERDQIKSYLDYLRFFDSSATPPAFIRKDLESMVNVDTNVDFRNWYSRLTFCNTHVNEIKITAYLMKCTVRTDKGVFETCHDALKRGFEDVAGTPLPLLQQPMVYITDPQVRSTITDRWSFVQTFKKTLYPGQETVCTFSIPDWQLDLSAFQTTNVDFNNSHHTYCWFVRVEGPYTVSPTGSGARLTKDLHFGATTGATTGIVFHSIGGEIVYNTGGPDFRKTVIDNIMPNTTDLWTGYTQVRDSAKTEVAVTSTNTPAT